MLVVAIDSSTLHGALGWISTCDSSSRANVDRFADASLPVAPGHAETLIDRIEWMLAQGGLSPKEVDLFVYGKGPGTFTGLRIGLSTVKGLAMACGAPIKGVSSLEALAFSSGVSGLVATLIDARRKELYAALYETSVDSQGWPVAKPLMEETVASAGGILEELERRAGGSTLHLLGNGVGPYEDLISRKLERAVMEPVLRQAPSAFWMARIGMERVLASGPDDLDAAEPVYIRAPDARLPGSKS